jgi:hypothetical protein
MRGLQPNTYSSFPSVEAVIDSSPTMSDNRAKRPN